nr:uncharacterized protein LOC109172115 [Ipomoea batatas]
MVSGHPLPPGVAQSSVSNQGVTGIRDENAVNTNIGGSGSQKSAGVNGKTAMNGVPSVLLAPGRHAAFGRAVTVRNSPGFQVEVPLPEFGRSVSSGLEGARTGTIGQPSVPVEDSLGGRNVQSITPASSFTKSHEQSVSNGDVHNKTTAQSTNPLPAGANANSEPSASRTLGSTDTYSVINDVWVRLPMLPLKCWHQKALSRIASRLGRPLYMDWFTKEQRKRDFARILVLMDSSVTPKETVSFKMPEGHVWNQHISIHLDQEKVDSVTNAQNSLQPVDEPLGAEISPENAMVAVNEDVCNQEQLTDSPMENSDGKADQSYLCNGGYEHEQPHTVPLNESDGGLQGQEEEKSECEEQNNRDRNVNPHATDESDFGVLNRETVNSEGESDSDDNMEKQTAGQNEGKRPSREIGSNMQNKCNAPVNKTPVKGAGKQPKNVPAAESVKQMEKKKKKGKGKEKLDTAFFADMENSPVLPGDKVVAGGGGRRVPTFSDQC